MSDFTRIFFKGKTFFLVLTIFSSGFFSFVTLVRADSISSEVVITKDGTVIVSNAKVVQLAGPTLYTRLMWGDAFIRMLVKATPSTPVYRKTGEATTVKEIAEGDFLDMEGTLESGGTSLVLIPKVIRNSSVNKLQAILGGTVTAVDTSASRFLMTTTNYGAVSINVGTSTQIVKGSRLLDLAHIVVGDTVKQATGDFNVSKKSLESKAVFVYLDPALFVPKLHLATFVSLTLIDNLPQLLVTSKGKQYTLITTKATTFLTKNKAPVVLSRFVAGDSLRLWGALKETDTPLIDVEVVRNMNL